MLWSQLFNTTTPETQTANTKTKMECGCDTPWSDGQANPPPGHLAPSTPQAPGPQFQRSFKPGGRLAMTPSTCYVLAWPIV